jgi:hypothetical protein
MSYQDEFKADTARLASLKKIVKSKEGDWDFDYFDKLIRRFDRSGGISTMHRLTAEERKWIDAVLARERSYERTVLNTSLDSS